MREILQELIDKHGFQSVLNELTVIAGNKITPLVVGYDVVWAASKDLNQLFYKLDRVRNGEAR